MPGKRLSLDQPFNKEVRCFNVVVGRAISSTADIKTRAFLEWRQPLAPEFWVPGYDSEGLGNTKN
jgi:hypothetical protein